MVKWGIGALAIAVALAACGSEMEAPDGAAAFESRPESIAGDVYSVTISEAATPESLESASREFCRDKQWCRVLGWRDEQLRARALPMMQREVDTVAINYLQNRASGHELVLFDCEAWPEVPAERCLSDLEESEQ